jgi:MinD superfamily P-loop ATPase
MNQIVVISGKGGTGKTVVTASFAALAEEAVLADVDVDAANLHLLLRPEIRQRHAFKAGGKARIDPAACNACGRCLEVCRFDALATDASEKVRVDSLACEGCGLCARVCAPAAIAMETPVAGEWFVSTTRFGPFVHARLGVAQENSGKLVAVVAKKAREIAEREGRQLLIMDGAPGIGCPVIASLSGADLALVVTEPTLSGAHDMERIVGLARHFKVRTACAVNKWDLNPDNSGRIEGWCREQGVPVAGRIPFEAGIVGSVVRGVPYVEDARGTAAAAIRGVWAAVLGMLTDGATGL